MPQDLYIVYNSLNAVQKKEAYDFIMRLALSEQKNESREIRWEKFCGRGERCFPVDVQEYIASLRENDR